MEKPFCLGNILVDFGYRVGTGQEHPATL
jgi:hypothetical protein